MLEFCATMISSFKDNLPDPDILLKGESTSEATRVQVAIVGAGPAGIGTAVVLQEFGLLDVAILERHQVGASFERWPAEMRFISPSFTSNAFGLLDLNAAALGTSPAYNFRTEHPSGRQYAKYLRSLVDHYQLSVWGGLEVRSITPLPEGGFHLKTTRGVIEAEYVVWAAGEFQYPNKTPFPGAEWCVHNSQVPSWKEIEGHDRVVIGGYESGIDAAVNLVKYGGKAVVLDRQSRWEDDDSDPSISLAPVTYTRLKKAMRTGRLEMVSDVAVERVERTKAGFRVVAKDGRSWDCRDAPVLAVGFEGSLSLINDLFAWTDEGNAELTAFDESTLHPGLFLTGPSVRQEGAILCFIYKFRQRFAVVARAIAERMGLETESLVEEYRLKGMYMDDFSCCEEECDC